MHQSKKTGVLRTQRIKGDHAVTRAEFFVDWCTHLMVHTDYGRDKRVKRYHARVDKAIFGPGATDLMLTQFKFDEWEKAFRDCWDEVRRTGTEVAMLAELWGIDSTPIHRLIHNHDYSAGDDATFVAYRVGSRELVEFLNAPDYERSVANQGNPDSANEDDISRVLRALAVTGWGAKLVEVRNAAKMKNARVVRTLEFLRKAAAHNPKVMATLEGFSRTKAGRGDKRELQRNRQEPRGKQRE